MDDFTFFSFVPRAALQPFVDSVWGVRGAGYRGVEAVLPNGAVELMVNFGPPQAVVGHGDRPMALRFRDAWLSGIQDRRLVHAADRGVDHISVRFRAGGAHAFFDLPMFETTNSVIELEELIGSGAVALRDRLGGEVDDRRRAEAFQDWLLERKRVAHSYPTVHRAVVLLTGDPAGASVAAVCDRLGLSNKSLIDQFRRTVGLTPKTVGRIARFQSVIDACRGRDRVTWAELAHSSGYADQPHLIREFRRLAGVTPSEYLRSRTPDGSSVLAG